MWLAAAATFNLICAGTVSHKELNSEGHEPYSYVYRIDLDAKKYCNGECKGLIDIQDIRPTRIIIKDEKIDTPREHRAVFETIDRETGRHYRTYSTGLRTRAFIMTWEGKCERAPFSGFPNFQTKF